MALAEKSGLCHCERQKEENQMFDRFSEVVPPFLMRNRQRWHSNQKLNIPRVQDGSILKKNGNVKSVSG